MKKYLERFRNVRLYDLFAVIQFITAIIPSIIWIFWCRMNNKRYWLICEDENEARDNGFVFFEYMKKEHPEIKVYYAINKKSGDYNKIKKYEPYVIEYRTLRHWIYYLGATVNISSQKGGKPNAAVCYILEVSGFLKTKRVFLQHGIMLNNATFLHYENTKMRLFITGAYPEHKYILETFGYPIGWVRYCGLCRFDLYHDCCADKKKILLMPSWRNWLKLKSKTDEFAKEERGNIKTSEYVQTYQKLITNPKLLAYLQKHGVELYFCPHRNMQKHLEMFDAEYPIILCDQEKYDIQRLLMECSLMITDYSSVSIDFAYMKKPVIYYQFDEKRYREQQYGESYFSYKDNGFGVVTWDTDSTVDEIINSIESGYMYSDKAQDAHNKFFKLFDANNCERNYKAICDILNPTKS